MISRTWPVCLLSALPLIWSVSARAQADDQDTSSKSKAAPAAKDDDETEDEAPAPSSKSSEGAKGEAHESLVPPKPVEPEEPPPVGPVERLPPTAYPEWKVRGIRGGSLWLSGNMHGMPWPYYPKTGIGVSGYIWLDTGYRNLKPGTMGEAQDKHLLSDGRGALRITPTYSAGSWYVQGQAEFIANKDQTAARTFKSDIDDLWIRAGQWKSWDIQAGRFEGFEVYHFGMGMDLNTQERNGASGNRPAPDVFELGGDSNIVYRPDSLTNVAAHYYPLDVLRFELLGQVGRDNRSTLETTGVRPAAVVDLGWLKLKAGADYRKQFTYDVNSKQSRVVRGGVGAVQVVVDPYFELGANLALGKIDHYSAMNSTDPNATMGDHDTAGSVTDLDTGGFANVRVVDGLLVGGGVNYNQETDEQSGVFTHLQTFGAVQYVVLKQLYIKFVGAYAKAHFAPGGNVPWDNTMVSARLRMMYLF